MSNTINNAPLNNNYQIANNSNSSNFVPNASLEDSNLFLKMMTVGMQTQDPTNPTDSSEFMNQMLQFTTMETLSKVTDSLEALIEISSATNMNNVINTAIEFTGKNVTVSSMDELGNSKEVSGIVDAVSIENTGIFLEINGEKYEYDSVVAVKR